jgi:hypothetical protein
MCQRRWSEQAVEAYYNEGLLFKLMGVSWGPLCVSLRALNLERPLMALSQQNLSDAEPMS